MHCVEELSGDEEDSNELFVGAVHSSKRSTAWYSEIRVENQPVNFKLDTGAQVNVLPLHEVQEKFPDIILKDTTVELTSYSSHGLDVIGEVDLLCEVGMLDPQIFKFIVVDTENSPILGVNACEDLNLVKRVHGVSVVVDQNVVQKNVIAEGKAAQSQNAESSSGNGPKVSQPKDSGKKSKVVTGNRNQKCRPCHASKESVYEVYSDVFTGLGEMPGEYHITISDDSTPVVHACRKIPYALHDKLQQKLDNMVKMGVIVGVDEPTSWVNSLVVVEKKNGDLRVCLDPRDLNKVIQREHHPTPKPEDVAARLHGKKIFSLIDQKDGYWQVKLDEESSKLCTFNTPFGRYRFLRMPFGISSAAEVFQKTNEKLFGDIPNCYCIADDMLIAGADDAEHDETIRRVMERARECGVKFNFTKLQWKVPEVTYMGNVISEEGLKADPKKIEAITDYPRPTSVQELQRFLGMVNYLGQFVNNLSVLEAPLRELLRKDVEFQWNPEQEKSFNNVKEALTKTPILAFFDPKKEVVIQCDASKDGIGACLLQDGRPIAYASRAMLPAETRYAQIEKELLAIVYSMDKFSQYVYGRTVTVHSDHKPLESVFKKSVTKASPRLQRMLMRLQRYSLQVVYKRGKEMHIADALSRAYLTTDLPDSDLLDDMEAMVHSLVQNSSLCPKKREEIRVATAEDPELQELSCMIRRGWPNSKKSVPGNLKQFLDKKDVLYEAEGLIFVENRIFVPHDMRKEILDLLHESHLGIEKSRNQAKEVLFWPGMSRDIESSVKDCPKCVEFSRNQQKEKMTPHPVPDRPWQKVGVDLFLYGGNDYLCVVDYFSKYPIVRVLKDKTAHSVIVQMKSIFGEHGIPEEVVSDNVPFNSVEFRGFAREYGFISTTISPTYSQSNGQVERAIGTIKQLLRKADDPYIALLGYRNSPIKGLEYSPAQLFFSRRLKTKLPTSEQCLQPEVVEDAKAVLVQRQEEMRGQYDKQARDLPPLDDQEVVRIKEGRRWKPAIVVSKSKTPRSYIVQTEQGKKFRRNRRHLKNVSKKSTKFLNLPDAVSEPQHRAAEQTIPVPVTQESPTPTPVQEIPPPTPVPVPSPVRQPIASPTTSVPTPPAPARKIRSSRAQASTTVGPGIVRYTRSGRPSRPPPVFDL